MRLVRGAATLATAGLAVLGLGACDPLPRAQFVVDSTALGADGNPGDGSCSAPTAGGACTVQAAIEEAAALGPTDIHVPAGTYTGNDSAPLTAPGDVTITGDGVGATQFSGYAFLVTGSGSLSLTDLAVFVETDLVNTVTVQGTLDLNRTSVGGWGTAIAVTEGGSLGAWNSIISGISPVTNDGTVAVYGSTMQLVHGRWGGFHATGDAVWAATATAPYPVGTVLYLPNSCDSTGLTSLGYNRTGWGCGLNAVGDSTGLAETEFEANRTMPLSSSPLIDAIPIGEAGCSVDAVDLYGNPRGVDGNGDGIPGCDIGAVERQP